MSTSAEYLARFQRIDQEVRLIDLGSPGPPGSMERLVALYRAIRPMLRAIVGMPLLLPGWRKVIEMFVATLDIIAISFDPTFKAAKDV
jgi:hypothetical protein